MDEHFSRPEFGDFPISLHLSMIRDSERMDQFYNAIKSTVSKNDSVIDIGSGTGILSFFASDAGAQKVTGVEMTSLAEYANQIAKQYSPKSNIRFIQEDIFEFQFSKRKYDVAICELLGSFGIDENIVSVLKHVRENLLAKNGKLIPEALELFVAPVQCTTAYNNLANWKPKLYGIDFSPIQELAYNSVYHISGDALKLLAPPEQLIDIDFYSISSLPNSLDAIFEFNQKATLHGIAGWFRSKLSEDLYLDTSPKHDTHWGQIFFPIGDPINIEEKGTLTFKFEENNSKNLCNWKWSGEIMPDLKNEATQKFAYNATREFTG